MAWNLLDDLDEGIIVADTNGVILYKNHAALSLTGLKSGANPSLRLETCFAPEAAWEKLLEPPEEAVLLSGNGRALRVRSKNILLADHTLIQINLAPARPDANQPAPINVLAQLATLTSVNRAENFHQKLQKLVDSLQETGWNRVILTLRDENFHPTQIIAAGFTREELAYLREHMLPASFWLNLFNNESLQRFRQGNCYFVPGTSRWSQENLQHILPDPQAKTNGREGLWHPKDLLCVPLYDRKQRRIGLIGLDQPANGRRPDETVFRTIELYAQFASSIIENALLVEESLARSHESEILLDASAAFSSTLDKTAILELLGQHLLRAVQADGYTIYQWRSEENSLITLKDYAANEKSQTIPAGTAVPLHPSGAWRAPLQEQTAVVISAREENLPLPPPPWLNPDRACTCVLLPLLMSGETFGLIHIASQNHKEQFNQRALRLLQAIANQAGAALETSLIFEDTYERERFYGALGNVNLALNSTLDKDTILNLICSESRRIFNVDGAYIWQITENQLIGSAASGLGEKEFTNSSLPLDTPAGRQTFVHHILTTGTAAYANQLQQTKQFTLHLPQAGQIQAILGVPLAQEGSPIGVLILADVRHPDRFSDKDISRATTFGVQVAIALQNAKLFAELRALNEELDLHVARRTQELREESNRVKILLRITSELSASLDQDRVLNQALKLVNEVVNGTDGAILLLDQEAGEFIFRASLTQTAPISPKGIPSGLKMNEGLAGWILDNRSAVIVHNTQEDPRWVARDTSSDYQSVLGVPLISGEEVIGVLMMFHSEPNAFTTQQLDLVEAAAIQVANAINNASLYELIFEQAEKLGSMLRSEIIQTANLQAIVESIADGVIVANDENIIEMANMPACNILDIPRDQLLGKPVNELLGLYGQFGQSWTTTMERWAQNASEIKQWTYLADKLNIEDKFISLHLSPILSEGHFFGTVSIFRDITKDVELDRLKSEFVSTVSHELRTPMTSIKGYADLMIMGAAGALTEPQMRYLQVIKNNANRLHNLVNDLLDISRIETGKTTLDLRPLDVPQIIAESLEHLHGRIQHEGKQLEVATQIAPALPLVNADHARVIQILTNLLDNAFNYTPENGKITIIAEPGKNNVYLSVADTGIGISEENQEKIFDRFFRSEDAIVQKVAGTGLGLSIVRSLVEMHGGRLQLESRPGQGSTFTFNLPIVAEDGEPA